MFGSHVAWIFVALLLGLCVGWLTYARNRSRVIDAISWIACGLLIVVPVLLPDVAAAATPLGTLLVLLYFIGCPIGWGLRHEAWIERSDVERHAEGYVFRSSRTAIGSVGKPRTMSAQPGVTPNAPAPRSAAVAAIATGNASQPIAEAAVASAAAASQIPPPAVAFSAPSAGASPAPEPTTGTLTKARPNLGSNTTAGVSQAAAGKGGAAAPTADRTSRDPSSQVGVAPSDASATPGAITQLPPASSPVPDQEKYPGVRPPGFVAARQDRPDDLQMIRGIGPQNEDRLHRLGIWHFDQIGAWTADEVRWVGSYLAFPGRIDREKWVEQARDIAAGAITSEASARRPARPRP